MSEIKCPSYKEISRGYFSCNNCGTNTCTMDLPYLRGDAGKPKHYMVRTHIKNDEGMTDKPAATE